MRNIRRTPPSRVGYGASVGRRRLLHTYVEEAEPADAVSLADPDLDFLIPLKVDASREAASLIRWQRGDVSGPQTLTATVSRARGR